MATTIPRTEQDHFEDAHFPFAGIDIKDSFSKQKARPLRSAVLDLLQPPADYARSTPTGINVRGYEPTTNRRRGGARPGITQYITAPVVAGWLIQELNIIVTVTKQ